MFHSAYSGRRVRGGIAALTTALVAAALTLVGVAAPASAANPSTTLSFDGSATLQDYGFAAGCDTCIPGDDGVGVRLTASVKAHWSPTATMSYQYSQSLLRQGQTLDLVDKLTPGSGPLTLTWGLDGDVGLYNFTEAGQPSFPDAGSEEDVAPFHASVSETTTCPLKLSGDGNYSCQATHTFTVLDATFLGQGVVVSVPLTTTLQITPDGVTTVRSITFGAGSPLTGNLQFDGPSPSSVADPVQVPCTVPSGNDLIYDLTGSETSPSFDATTTVNIKVDVTVVFTVNVVDETIATIGPESGQMVLTAPSAPVDFGAVLPNNVPPDIELAASFSGAEGQEIEFDASGTTSVCGDALAYVWNFSDGGTEFGATPKHKFADNGSYTGMLTVTDTTGNSSKQSFTVSVSNVAPVSNAGPDTSAVWGRNVAFNGSAVDPGSVDQATLAYTWDFGDGTPSATSGGASATHAYAEPGSYVATLVACDKNGACSPASARTITVGKRNVTVSYLGATSGTFDTPVPMSASVVDQFGNAVNSAPVAFAIGSENEGTIGTNSSGIAGVTPTTQLPAGSYTASASYAGSAKYNAGAASSPFAVGVKATSVTYTGAVTGGPNKVITLSAVVKDAAGKAVAGAPVTFTLGSQTASATANGNGIAATTLKLAQKNGTYTLTASYGGLGGKYAPSSTVVTFKLQAK
ncbi:PKD domain-containing protein [Microbacterium jejuense]|uniref:PKD domain-containing protein n=1 Tax=Microbacterium jejuense TaxID=1263637 RepID=UPI0031E84574